jgi:hypothetical protein
MEPEKGAEENVRLVRMALCSYDVREDAAERVLGSIAAVREAAPEGCVVRMHCWSRTGTVEWFVACTIVAVVAAGLSEDSWMDVCSRMQAATGMERLTGLVLFAREEEAGVLEDWEKEPPRAEEAGGSWSEVRAAVGLRAEAVAT